MHYSICGREMLYGRLAYKRKWEKEALKTPEYPSSSCVIKGRGRQWDVYCAHKIFPSGNKSLWRIAADRPTPAGAPPAPTRIQGIEMPFYSFLCINMLRQIFGRVGAGLPAVMYTTTWLISSSCLSIQIWVFYRGKSHTTSQSILICYESSGTRALFILCSPRG